MLFRPRLPAEENIRSDVQVSREVQFLVDESDAQPFGGPHIGNADSLSFDLYLSLVRLVYPGQALHERALASAIFPHHSHHFARAKGRTHLLECAYAAEALADRASFKQRLRRGFRRHRPEELALGCSQVGLQFLLELFHVLFGDRSRWNGYLLIRGKLRILLIDHNLLQVLDR